MTTEPTSLFACQPECHFCLGAKGDPVLYQMLGDVVACGACSALVEAAEPDTNKLLDIIGAAYQIAGAHDVPAHILDVLADPEDASAAQVEALLPYAPAKAAELWQIREAAGAFACWWAMIQAQEELAGEQIKDEAVILHFSGSGASTSVTAGQLRTMFNLIYAEGPPTRAAGD